jgi:hypothetical protein
VARNSLRRLNYWQYGIIILNSFRRKRVLPALDFNTC